MRSRGGFGATISAFLLNTVKVGLLAVFTYFLPLWSEVFGRVVQQTLLAEASLSVGR